MELIRLFVSEIKKTKRTLALLLAVSAPSFVVLLNILSVWLRPIGVFKADAWNVYLNNIPPFWAMLMAPLYISVLLGLLSELEFANNNWKLIFSQPVSKFNIYLSKLFVTISLVLFSNVIVFLGGLAGGELLAWIRPDLGFNNSAPDIHKFFVLTCLTFVASLLIIAIHTWLSMRFRSFVASVVIAVFAVVGNLMAMNYDLFQRFFPWVFPLDTIMIYNLAPGETLTSGITLKYILTLSVVGAIIITIIGAIDISRKDVA